MVSGNPWTACKCCEALGHQPLAGTASMRPAASTEISMAITAHVPAHSHSFSTSAGVPLIAPTPAVPCCQVCLHHAVPGSLTPSLQITLSCPVSCRQLQCRCSLTQVVLAVSSTSGAIRRLSSALHPDLTCPLPCLQLQRGFAGTACSATPCWQHLRAAALQAQLAARGTVWPPLRLLQVSHAIPWQPAWKLPAACTAALVSLLLVLPAHFVLPDAAVPERLPPCDPLPQAWHCLVHTHETLRPWRPKSHCHLCRQGCC